MELRPAAEGDGYEIELTGDIVRMIDLGAQNRKAAPSGAAVPEAFARSAKMVAGAGFEPAAFRL